ncbi:hypothetical protein WJX84_002009 [Apatococcus fuscideae]|uniref:BZIP domain-containing protein n=1 Tax=Apatococcus fuscideae TaxID=2026836 RepID=A0AAW1SN26_9CHLO
MGDRHVVSSGTNFGCSPLALRVTQFGGPRDDEFDRNCTRGEMPHGQDAYGFEHVAQCGTGIDLDSATLSAVLGSDSLLCHPRSGGDACRASFLNSSSTLAASTGLLLASADPAHSSTTLERLRNVSELRPSSADDRDDGLESDSNTKDGSDGKRKGPVSDAERKKRRQEVNRQSARRIRERRNNEMEYLKQQVQTLQHQHGLLLKYTSQLAKEKNQLIQRAMELTERWNATAAENLELRSRLQDDNVQLPGI